MPQCGNLKGVPQNAPKLARLIYSMLALRTAYTDLGQEYYEQRYRTRAIQNLKRKAQELGFELVTTGKAAAL